MKFKKVLTLFVFLLFAVLCSYQMMGNIQAGVQNNSKSVLHVRSIEKPAPVRQNTREFDINAVIKNTDLDG